MKIIYVGWLADKAIPDLVAKVMAILSRWIKKKLAGLKRETACAINTPFIVINADEEYLMNIFA